MMSHSFFIFLLFEFSAYAKQAAERERALLAARSSSPSPLDPSSQSSSITASLSSTGVN